MQALGAIGLFLVNGSFFIEWFQLALRRKLFLLPGLETGDLTDRLHVNLAVASPHNLQHCGLMGPNVSEETADSGGGVGRGEMRA